MNLKIGITIMGAAVAAFLTASASADDPPDGNRYYSLPRAYLSEISVSEAYLAMEHSKDHKNVSGEPKPVLIDVRSLREYASGHPEDAYNVPYPTVSGLGGDAAQNPGKLYQEVYRIVRGRTDTPIMTLCRTGHRSVLAGNILADPEHYGLPGLEPFTNVRNIWEGFVGQPKYAFDTGSDLIHLFKVDPVTGNATKYELMDGELVDPVTKNPVLVDFDGPLQLDLNNNEKIDSDTADVYTQTKDANPDKDGWRNFAGLPWTTHIQKPLAYERDPSLYQALDLTPVQ